MSADAVVKLPKQLNTVACHESHAREVELQGE